MAGIDAANRRGEDLNGGRMGVGVFPSFGGCGAAKSALLAAAAARARADRPAAPLPRPLARLEVERMAEVWGRNNRVYDDLFPANQNLRFMFSVYCLKLRPNKVKKKQYGDRKNASAT